jgi:hypothetical protein
MPVNFSAEWLLIFYVANQVVSAAVQALPPPNGNKFYQFFYKFVSLLTADFKSFAAQIPAPTLLTNKSTTGSITTVEVPKVVEK